MKIKTTMNKVNYLFTLLAIIALSVTSCNKIQEEPIVKADNSIHELYIKTINDFSHSYNQASTTRSSESDAYEIPAEYSNYASMYSNVEDFRQLLNKKNYTETTKKILLQLPKVFISNYELPTIEEITNYNIPIEEKEILAQTVGLIDGIKAQVFKSQTRITYEEAMERCFDDYLGDLGMAVVEGVGAGAVGALGGPVGAGVSCAVVGTIAVIKAQISFNRCKRNAKDLK